MRLIELLPSLYRSLLSAPQWHSPYSETRATCHNCLMAEKQRFAAHLKCCTFFPDLPNFLVGAIFAQGGLMAEQALQLVQTEGSPLGLTAPQLYREVYQSSGRFGQQPELLCPFFDRTAHRCGIWAHRPSTCATYFCESSHGERGQHRWQQVDQFLGYVEMCLAQHALLECGFHWREIEHSLTGQPDWAHWQHTRGELMCACWEWVQQLSPDQVSELLGEEGRALESSALCGL